MQTAAHFDKPRLLTELLPWVNQKSESARLQVLLISSLHLFEFTIERGRAEPESLLPGPVADPGIDPH